MGCCTIVIRAAWFSTTKTDDFAGSGAAGLRLEFAQASGRLTPALPGGEQLLQSNLYSVCELVAARAARALSARQYLAIETRCCDALR
jgi:hypothetical protein